jgi:hypothetical protein
MDTPIYNKDDVQAPKSGWLHYLQSNIPHAFILLFLLVLSSISFYTTYDGLIRFSYGSFAQTPTVFIIVLFLFVTVLQGMLLFSLYEMLHSRFVIKFLWLFVYLVTMGVSVFFSYSFYYNLFRADSYAFDNFSSQLNQIKKSALNYQDSFLQIRNDTEKLADYSRRRAEEERQRGGTCGYMSPPNSGPRSRYRDKEANIFTALSSDISDLYDGVSTDIRQLEALVKTYMEKKDNTDDIQNKMNKVVLKLNRYKASGKVLNLNSTLRDHMYDRRKTDGKDALGYAIACPDENIDIKGTAIVKQITSLPKVQDVLLFDPNSDVEVLTRALTVFMQIPKAILPDSILDKLFTKKTQAEADATKITPLDYAPLLLGGLIDLFIFIVGLADGLENKKRHWGLKGFSGKYIEVENIPSMGQVANEELFLSDLRSHVHRNRIGYTLIIPASTNRLNERTRGIQDLVEAMESTNLLSKPKKYNSEWNELPKSLQNSMAELYSDASHRKYNQYKLPTMLWKELQQAYYSWHIYHEV